MWCRFLETAHELRRGCRTSSPFVVQFLDGPRRREAGRPQSFLVAIVAMMVPVVAVMVPVRVVVVAVAMRCVAVTGYTAFWADAAPAESAR